MELEQLAPSEETARRLLEDAGRHLAAAATALETGDLRGAYQRGPMTRSARAPAGLLAVQGLRATSRGGHLAVQEAMAQFGSTVRAFRAFGRIRRVRNQFEYPSPTTPELAAENVTDAIIIATQACAATTILGRGVLTPW